MADEGSVTVDIDKGIGTISFFHPKRNSLPGSLLRGLAETVTDIGNDKGVRVLILRSEGEKTFCAGASIDELTAIDSFETGKEFFMGFARLILAMKKCPRFIITRVQGKAVGGAVGIIAASDYALALDTASIKLSELSLAIGPFVIGPAVEKKAGFSAFSQLAVDTEWHDAEWVKRHGLYANILSSMEELDRAVSTLAEKLKGYSPEAMAMLKNVFWQGTNHWDSLLELRAEISGRLVISGFARKAISALKKNIHVAKK